MAARVVPVDAGNPSPGILSEAAALLRSGEVIVCPTDTGYAFSANALDEAAIARVFQLKGRSFANPVHIAVPALEEAGKYVFISENARRLARAFLPGALTLVLPGKGTVPSVLVAGMSTVGIRIPGNRVILGLVELAGLPVTTTSANVSGKPTPYDIAEIRAQYGEGMEGITLVLDQGRIEPPELSTIVDLATEPPQLLRQGRIGWQEIREVLGLT